MFSRKDFTKTRTKKLLTHDFGTVTTSCVTLPWPWCLFLFQKSLSRVHIAMSAREHQLRAPWANISPNLHVPICRGAQSWVALAGSSSYSIVSSPYPLTAPPPPRPPLPRIAFCLPPRGVPFTSNQLSQTAQRPESRQGETLETQQLLPPPRHPCPAINSITCTKCILVC